VMLARLGALPCIASCGVVQRRLLSTSSGKVTDKRLTIALSRERRRENQKAGRTGADLDQHTRQIVKVLYECLNTKDSARALSIVRSEPHLSTEAYNMALNVCCKAMRLDHARIVFREMPERQLIAFNAIINCAGRKKKLSQAKMYFHSLQQEGHKPDLVTYTSLMNAHGVVGRLAEAEALWKQLCDKFRPNAVCFTTIMAACAAAQDAARCRHYFEMLKEYKIEPSLPHFSALLSAVVKSGEPVEAVAEEMVSAGIEPTSEVYSILLKAYVNDVDKCAEIFRIMRDKGVQASPSVYRGVAEALAASGDRAAAMKVVRTAEKAPIAPAKWSYIKDDIVNNSFKEFEACEDEESSDDD